MESGRQKVTRKDVAREAGVSETIVSYVLNKNRYVKEEKGSVFLRLWKNFSIIPTILQGLFTEKAACRFFSCRRTEQWLFFRTGKPDEQGCLQTGIYDLL